MIDFLRDAPLWLIAVLLVLLGAIIWLTDWLAWHKGRLFGLHEADQRNRQQLRLDYERGISDGVRRSSPWLAGNGRQAAAEGLPRHLLTERQPTSDPH